MRFLWNGMRYQRNSNGYPDIFDHALVSGDVADIARRQPRKREVYRFRETFYFRFSVSRLEIRGPLMSDDVGSVTTSSGVVENVRVAV